MPALTEKTAIIKVGFLTSNIEVSVREDDPKAMSRG